MPPSERPDGDQAIAMPRLIFSRPGETSRVFELLGDRPVSIGRAKSSNVVLEGESISRLHAVLHSTPDGQWQIVDRGCANGLRINELPRRKLPRARTTRLS